VRDWHRILEYHVTADGRCESCHGAIAGRYEQFVKAFGQRRIPVRLAGLSTS
jgi:pyruvate formate lyase activating enzyme